MNSLENIINNYEQRKNETKNNNNNSNIYSNKSQEDFQNKPEKFSSHENVIQKIILFI